ncbi:MAG: DUF4258 domain-containing protein [Bacteroidota bacterium]|nr:DUF4258 domain-containing protein [Patescibacteria group bacterium]
MIYFTKHAKNKFLVLEKHNIYISEKQVKEAIENPDDIDHSRMPLLIAQSQIDSNHVLRVVYKQKDKDIKVITFYPGRIKQYGIS